LSSQTHRIAATIHGRYIVEAPRAGGPFPMLVGFHGYAERAEDMMGVLQRIRGERGWLLVSVQALNRFYTKSQEIVANWMTREDRDLVIDDNIAYVASVVAAVRREHTVAPATVYVGFSQGVAMAYRAAAFAAERQPGVPRAAGGIMLAGDVPPDVAPHVHALPPILIGRGTDDTWYTETKATADIEHFRKANQTPQLHVFKGGHVWEDSFIAAAGQFLDRIASADREPVNPVNP
jgi:predicted esterase